jgi:hypothetical protein
MIVIADGHETGHFVGGRNANRAVIILPAAISSIGYFDLKGSTVGRGRKERQSRECSQPLDLMRGGQNCNPATGGLLGLERGYSGVIKMFCDERLLSAARMWSCSGLV